MVHFAMLQTTKYCSRIQVKTHSTIIAINFLVDNRLPPKWLVLRKSCELIVLRVREVIIFNNSNFTAVKKTASMRMGGVEPPLWLRHCRLRYTQSMHLIGSVRHTAPITVTYKYGASVNEPGFI